MGNISIKKILIIAALLIAFLGVSISLIQRYFWIKNNEIRRIKEYFTPAAVSLGEMIKIRLNDKVSLLVNISHEISKNGVFNRENQKILDSIRERNSKNILGIGILDKKGRAIFYSPAKDSEGNLNVGKDFSDRDYFKKVVKEKEPIIGEILFGRVTKKQLIPIITPIKNEGVIEGYLLAGINVEIVREIIETFVPFGEGKVTVVDEKGKVISMPHAINFEEEMKDLSQTPIFKEAQKNVTGISYFLSLFDNKKKIGVYYRLNNNWVLWISSDIEEINQRIEDAFYFAFIWGIVILIISSMFGVLLSFYISKPILKLTEYVRKIAKGNFDIEIKSDIHVTRIKEVKILYESFQSMAKDLKNIYDNLDYMVKERTKELNDAIIKLKETNEMLEIKKEEAEIANKAKSDFLANMSHEIRTPLNAIIGFTDLLLMDDSITGEAKKQLGYISESARHLLSLINDILDLSKVEAGKLEPFMEPIVVKNLVEETFMFFKEKSLKHRIKTGIEIEDGLPIIKGDKRLLKQVLFNLLSNSFKFTPDGGEIGVKVRLYRDIEDSKDYILFEVYDTGIGISKEKQNQLFQPFVQLDNIMTKKFAGTGLGLSLCKRFVELHKGKIWLESEDGKGARFYFMIPVDNKEEISGTNINS